jgi:hypothetical protein
MTAMMSRMMLSSMMMTMVLSAADFIRHLLVLEPEKRLTAKASLQHKARHETTMMTI